MKWWTYKSHGCEIVGMRTTQAYWSSLCVTLDVILSDLHGKPGLCVFTWQRLQRQRKDDSVFNNTDFGVFTAEKPCSGERAFLGAPRGPHRYWLVYDRSTESALWLFHLIRLILPWVMPAIKATSNIYYYTVVTSPWTSPRRICDSELPKQM